MSGHRENVFVVIWGLGKRNVFLFEISLNSYCHKGTRSYVRGIKRRTVVKKHDKVNSNEHGVLINF